MDPIAMSDHLLAGTMAYILLLVGIAGVAVPLLQRLWIPSVLAYLLCGIAIGPHGLVDLAGDDIWPDALAVRNPHTVQMLGELGIVSLMFMIGLELSLDRLKELRRFIFGLGSAQIIVTGLAIFLIAWFFGNPIQVAILLGASLALSSTAIVMKLLEERRLANRRIGALCFSVLLMQDLAVVPILMLASSFSGSGTDGIVRTMATSLTVGVFSIFAIYVVGRRLLSPLLRAVSLSRNPEWLSAFTVFIVIACAAITYRAGLSPALGAFLAGLLISETEFRHEVKVIVAPVKGLLLGIFFLSIGMMIDTAEVLRHPLLLMASVTGIYLVKAAILFPLCLLFKVPGRQAAQAAVYLAQPGEFALLILGVAMSTQLMPAQDVQFFLLVTAIAMMFAPFAFRLAPLAEKAARRFATALSSEPEGPETEERIVVIAGFGRVGQLLGRALEERRIAYIAFDHDAERVRRFREQGFRVTYGDARKIELWQHLHGGEIIAAVIAIDDHDATYSILRSIRARWPGLSVIVRSKDTVDGGALYELGARHVVAETLESSLRIASLLMEQVGTEQAVTEKIIETLRERYATA